MSNQRAAAVGPTTTVVFDGRLTINEAQARHDELLEAMAQSASVAVDTCAVTAVDVAGIQLLLAAQRRAALAGGSFTLTARPTGALLEALTVGGFAQVNAGDVSFANEFWGGGK